MPVTRITTAQKAALLAGTATSHTVETVAAVNPQAGPYVYGLAFYGWAGGVSVVGEMEAPDHGVEGAGTDRSVVLGRRVSGGH